MGTWGAGLYQNDAALDARAFYRDCRKLGFHGDDLAGLVLETLGGSPDDEDGAMVELALADQLWSDGALSKARREAALDLIARSELPLRWEDAASRNRQIKALAALAQKLQSPQPVKQARPAPYIENCDFEIGEILAFPWPAGEWTLLCVIAFYTRFRGKSPIVEVLDWQGDKIPDTKTIKRLKYRKSKSSALDDTELPDDMVRGLIAAGRLPPGGTARDFEEQMASPQIPVIRTSERDAGFRKIVRLGINAPSKRPFLSHWYVATNSWTTWKDLPVRLDSYFRDWDDA